MSVVSRLGSTLGYRALKEMNIEDQTVIYLLFELVCDTGGL